MAEDRKKAGQNNDGKSKPANTPLVKKIGQAAEPAKEFGGQAGPEPTRYGDWEKNGRCTDF